MRRLTALLISAGLLVGAALLFSAAPAEAATGDLIKSWGVPGQQPGQLGFIYGLALDDQNRVWVADTSNDRVQRFSGSGNFQKEITRNFDNPEGVAIGADGKLYVADSLNDKIKVFGKSGAFKFKFGKSGSGQRKLSFPASVAIAASDGDILVADRNNDRVQKYRPDGTHDDSFDDLGLLEPNGVAVDPATDLIYIADAGNDRVVVVNHQGVFQDEWDTGDRPSMLAARNGFVYVTDGLDAKVEKFETDGDFVTSWDLEPDSNPCGVAITPGGNVYVAEFSKRRVQKFEG
jgi:tripartite motif-containing protein 71